MGAVFAVMAVLVVPSSAGAQDPNDPYGSTSTTRRPPRTATIELSVSSGPPGTEIEAYACGYAPATAGGSITFSGTVVASGLVADAEGCLTTDGSNPPRFVAPGGSRSGTHQVCAVVAGYNTPCARFRVTGNPGRGNTEVRGNQVERGEDGSDGGADPASSSNDVAVLGMSLPRTGLAVGLLLALAAALIVGGRSFLETSRRRGTTRPS